MPRYLPAETFARADAALFSQQADRDIWQLGFNHQADQDIASLDQYLLPMPEQAPIVVSDAPDAMALRDRREQQVRQDQAVAMPATPSPMNAQTGVAEDAASPSSAQPSVAVASGASGQGFYRGPETDTNDQGIYRGSADSSNDQGIYRDAHPAASSGAPAAMPTGAPASPAEPGSRRSHAQAMAQKYGVDWGIFDRQLNQESGYQDDAVSSVGARGPGQFMPATGNAVARQLGVTPEQFWASPELQIEGAALHMRDLLAANHGDYRMALAAYNAGQGNVDKYGEGVFGADFANGQTRDYVNIILGPGAASRSTPNAGAASPSASAAPPSSPASSTSSSGAAGSGGGGTYTVRDPWGNVFQMTPEQMRKRPGGVSDLTILSKPDEGQGDMMRVSLAEQPSDEPLPQAGWPGSGLPGYGMSERDNRDLQTGRQLGDERAIRIEGGLGYPVIRPPDAVPGQGQGNPNPQPVPKPLPRSTGRGDGFSEDLMYRQSLYPTDPEASTGAEYDPRDDDSGPREMGYSVPAQPSTYGDAGDEPQVPAYQPTYGPAQVAEPEPTAPSGMKPVWDALGNVVGYVQESASRDLGRLGRLIAPRTGPLEGIQGVVERGSQAPPSDNASRLLQESARELRPYVPTPEEALAPIDRLTGAPEGTAYQAAQDVSGVLGPDAGPALSAAVGLERRVARPAVAAAGRGARALAEEAASQLMDLTPSPSVIQPSGAGRPTVEVLQQRLEQARSIVNRLLDAGDPERLAMAQDNRAAIESALVDAMNARRALEPSITSDVGRRIESLPLDERTADDMAGLGRERARVTSGELSGPVGVPTDMSGRMNAGFGVVPDEGRALAPRQPGLERGSRGAVDAADTWNPLPDYSNPVEVLERDIGSHRREIARLESSLDGTGDPRWSAYAREQLPQYRAELADMERQYERLIGNDLPVESIPSRPVSPSARTTDPLSAVNRVLGQGVMSSVSGGVGAAVNQELNPDDPNAAIKGFAVGALGPVAAARGAGALARRLGRSTDLGSAARIGLGDVPPSQVNQGALPLEGVEPPPSRIEYAGNPSVSDAPNRPPALGDVPPSAIRQGGLPGMEPPAPRPLSEVADDLAVTPEQRIARANEALEQFPQARNWYERARMRNERQMRNRGIEPVSPLRYAADLVGQIGYSSMLGPVTASVNLFTGIGEPLWSIPKEGLRQVGRAIRSRNLDAFREQGQMHAGALYGMTRLGQDIMGAIRDRRLPEGNPIVDVVMGRGRFASNPNYPTLSERTTDPLLRLVAQATEVPGRIWTGLPDAIFGTIAMHSGQAREAAQIATDMGLSGKDWKAEVNQLLGDARMVLRGEMAPSTNVQRVVDAGNKYADRQTYRDELGKIGRMGQTLSLQRVPGLGPFASPFFRTIWTSGLRQAEKSPIGAVMNTQPTRFDKVYDALVGTALLSAIGAYATSGGVTGSGPADPKERELLQEKGWSRYSTLTRGPDGGMYYVPNRMYGIFETPLNIAGEIHDYAAHQKPDQTGRQRFDEGVKRIGEVIRQNPYALSGIMSILDAAQFGVASFASEQATRLTPFAATARAIGTAGDTMERTTDRGKDVDIADEIVQRWQQSVGARSGLPEAQGAFGQPKPNEQPGGWAFVPRIRRAGEAPVADIFREGKVPPGQPKTEIRLVDDPEIPPMPFTPRERRAWDRYRGEVLQSAGQGIAGDPAWKDAPPEVKEKVLRDVMAVAAEAADGRVLGEIGDEEINRRMNDLMAKKKRAS